MTGAENAPADPFIAIATPTELYRYFDDAGVLLYVGISFSTLQRALQHRRDKSWWRYAKTIDIEHYDTRDAALEAERLAIVNERPLCNIVHNAPERQLTDPPADPQDLDGWLRWLIENPHRFRPCRQRLRNGQKVAWPGVGVFGKVLREAPDCLTPVTPGCGIYEVDFVWDLQYLPFGDLFEVMPW